MWIELADVLRSRSKPEEERLAIVEALRISPSWSWANQLLAEWYERHSRFAEAIQVMERAIEFDRLNPYNYGFLASNLWKAGRNEEALDNLEQALDMAPWYGWAWSTLCDWCLQSNQRSRIQPVAERLTEKRPGLADAWLHLAQARKHMSMPMDQILEAYDKAIEVQPYAHQAYYQKAVTLSQAFRFDAALQVCESPHWNGYPPYEIQQARAIILHDMGRTADAIQSMRSLLDENPSDNFGWRTLANWYREQENADAYLQICDEIIKTNPNDAMSYGYRVSALIDLGRGDEIEGDCRKAIELNPEYEYAGRMLIQRLMGEKRYQEADEILAHVGMHWNEDLRLLCAIKLFLKRGRTRKALEDLEILLWLPAVEDWVHEDLAEQLFNAGKGDAAYRIYHRETRRGTICVTGARYWGWLAAHGKKIGRAKKLLGMGDLPEMVFKAGLHGLIERLGMDNRGSRLQAAMIQFESELKEDDKLWGAVGYALQQCNLQHDYDAWIRDYRERPGVQPWMLMNYQICCWRNNHPDRGESVLADALNAPPDQSYDTLQLFESIRLIRTGIPVAAADRLGQINPDKLNPYYRSLYELTRNTAELMEGPGGHDGGAAPMIETIRRHIEEQGPDPMFKNVAGMMIDRVAPGISSSDTKQLRKALKQSRRPAAAQPRHGTDIPWWVWGILIYFLARILAGVVDP